MKLKTFILSVIALIGMATPAFAKDKAPKNTENNVSPDTEQVSEHDMNVYGANYTDGDKFDGLTRKVGFDRMIPLTLWRSATTRPHTSSSRRKSRMSIWATKTLWPVSPMVRRTCCV